MTCRQCGGTGQVILMNSWFVGDTRKERCGICNGSGASSFMPDREFARWQADLRRVAAKMPAEREG